MLDKIKEARLVFLFEAIQRGSMRAAAEALNIAPSAVSRQISLLEDELSIPLIERHTRGIKPTEAGRLLLEYYREQRAHQHDLLSHLQELRGLRSGTVRIALGEGFVSDLMAGPLTRFSRDHATVSIVLDVAGTDELIRRISEDDADIGLVFNPPADTKIVSIASSRQPVQAIVGPDFPLLGQPGPFRIADFSALSAGAQPSNLWHAAYSATGRADRKNQDDAESDDQFLLYSQAVCPPAAGRHLSADLRRGPRKLRPRNSMPYQSGSRFSSRPKCT